jgi:hypothetical protein
MSLPLGGFTSGKADIRVNSLKCYDVQVLDKDCNLFIPGFGRLDNDLNVDGTLTVTKDLSVCGELLGKDKLRFLSDTAISGKMFSATDEFNSIATFQGNGNVTIELLNTAPISFVPTSVQIEQCPCGGVIDFVDPVTGNVTYSPYREPPEIDVYRYSAVDECGVRHKITQYICQQIVPIAPYMNNGCFEVNGDTTIKFSAADYIMEGTAPVDLSTVNLVQVLTDTSTSLGCPDVVTMGTFTGPDPLAMVTVDASGMVCVTIPSTDYAVQIQVTVADINGLISNVGTITINSLGD